MADIFSRDLGDYDRSNLVHHIPSAAEAGARYAAGLLTGAFDKRPRVPLYDIQQRYRDSEALWRGFVGGRGAGKSHIGAIDLIERAKGGRLYMVVAPTRPSLKLTSWRSFQEVANQMGCVRKVNLSDLHIIIATEDGGEAQVNFRGAHDPESLRGPNLSGCWMDEASLMQEAAFDIIIASLREGGEMGFLGLTFTPKGKGHWTYRIFHDKDGSPKPGKELFQATSKENPFLPANYYDVIVDKYVEGSTLARQELLGEFVDLSGLMFQRFWYGMVETIPHNAVRVRYWDKAATEGGGDWTCGVLMARGNEDRIFYVEDVVRGQWSPFERNRAIQQVSARDAEKYDNQVSIYVEQEPAASGKESAWITIQELAAYPVTADPVSGDKQTRAQPFQAQSEAGNVKIREAGWAEDWFEEITTFPEGKYKDQVDATAGAYNKLALMTGIATGNPLIAYPEAPLPEDHQSSSPPVEPDLIKWLGEYAGNDGAGDSGDDSEKPTITQRLSRLWGDDWDN